MILVLVLVLGSSRRGGIWVLGLSQTRSKAGVCTMDREECALNPKFKEFAPESFVRVIRVGELDTSQSPDGITLKP